MTLVNISKAIGPTETKFHTKPPGIEETETCSNRPGRMAILATTPIYGKNLQKSSSSKHSTAGLETLFVASGT